MDVKESLLNKILSSVHHDYADIKEESSSDSEPDENKTSTVHNLNSSNSDSSKSDLEEIKEESDVDPDAIKEESSSSDSDSEHLNDETELHAEEINDDLKTDSEVSASDSDSSEEMEEAKSTTVPRPMPLGRKRKLANNENSDCVRSEKEERLMELVFGNKKKLLTKLAESDTEPIADDALTKLRRPAWHDSDDENVQVDDVVDYTKKGAPLIYKPGKYTNYLKKNFETLLGTPSWANLDRNIEADSDDELKQTVGFLAKITTTKLPQHILRAKRLKDLNRATYCEGPGINAVEFHPTSSVALVAGRRGIATIYSIDGQKNDKLHSIEFKNFPIQCCRIARNGCEAFVGSGRKFFYTYDLMSGQTQRVFLPKDITKMTQFELSPCGKLLAIIGRFGEIHLMDAMTKELIASVKQEHHCTAVAFGADSRQLYAHSDDAEINIFDVGTRKIVHRFMDEGCVNGSTITVSQCGGMLASGSAQGVVNIYSADKLIQTTTMPKPLKTIFNLTTSVTAMQFNHSSEMLAVCSREINDAIKLVHLPSGTVFSNFPDSQSKLGKPNVLAISPQSGYVAVGNLSKEVALFRLKHFSNY